MPPKLVSKDESYVSPLEELKTKQLAKRIRVARACDTCRRRKVKCDGKLPCIHCTVYSYECTYNQFKPAKKVKKNPDDVPFNKNKVHEALVKLLLPGLEINEEFKLASFKKIYEKRSNNELIETIKDYQISQMSPLTDNYSSIPSVISPIEIKIILPPREIALKLIYKTWNESCVLFRFYHRPSFIEDFNSLYEVDPNFYSNHQNKILPLIYSVIGVGALFAKGDNKIDNKYLQDEGFKYFIESKKLIDITNSNDIESVQTIFMLTLFLQCSAKLSTCYSYIGIAIRSALKQNLHKISPTPSNNLIEEEIRKRLFWTIFKLEIYVNSILGLPNSINEDDIEISLPQDIDDMNISKDQIKPQMAGKLSSCGMNNSHTKLILILNHIVKNQKKLLVNNEIVKILENELKIWYYELPIQLIPNNANIPADYVKANKLLHLDYLYVQLVLYKPFLNYLKLNFNSIEYKFGYNCIEISKNIILLAKEMLEQKLLNGSYWFSNYTIFFAMKCLIFFNFNVNMNDKSLNLIIDIGKDILFKLKDKSNGANKIFKLFEKFSNNGVIHEKCDIKTIDYLDIPEESEDGDLERNEVVDEFNEMNFNEIDKIFSNMNNFENLEDEDDNFDWERFLSN